MSGAAIFVWPIDSHFGWGIRGLNYALSWPGVAVSAMPEGRAELPPDDPRWPLLRERIAQSRRFQSEILAKSGENVEIEAPVLVAMGNDLTPQRTAFGRVLRGRPTIACPVFEDVESVKRNIARLEGYDAVVVASRWNQEVLDGLGVAATLCHEGIDPTIFNPGVRASVETSGKYRVFSGGKVEYRKGQDIVIEAFRRFAEAHDDAVLVAAWGSPFGFSGQDFEGKWEHGAPPGSHIGRPNFHAWVERAGIKPHQFGYVEPCANWRMAETYAGCDVAVFPNRREGGTNFVAMEAMGCGVPTVRSPWHGHADLLNEPGMMTSNYNKEDVSQAAEWLSYVYHHGFKGQELSEHWTWERHCNQMAVIARAQ